jgi:hypothetical protein
MANILNTTQVYNAADVVTHTNLNQIISGATFVTGTGGTTDNVTLEVDGTSGSLQVKDGGIDQDKLSTGHPRWSATSGRLYVDGMLDNNNYTTAGIQVNQNLVGDLGYAFIDLHGDSTVINEYVRLLNSNGKCFIQNKKAGEGIYLDTTDSSGTQRTGLRVDSNQNVIIHDSITGDSNTGRVVIFGGTNGNGANIELYAGSHNNGPNKAYYDAVQHNFRSVNGSPSNGMKLDTSNGQLHVGDLSNISLVTGVQNSVVCEGRLQAKGSYVNTSGQSANLYIDSNGMIWRTPSSARYKENIKDYSKGIEAIKTLRPVTYESINEDDDNTYAGFIAEEVHDAGLTEFVEYNPEGQPDSLHYSHMTAVLTKALQESINKIETLEARVTSLENS